MEKYSGKKLASSLKQNPQCKIIASKHDNCGRIKGELFG